MAADPPPPDPRAPDPRAVRRAFARAAASYDAAAALQREVNRRRSFAIISHPDAGKTTLTEKFLLYGGALNLAGSVTAHAIEHGV